MSALRQHLAGAGSRPFAPLWVDYLVMIGTTLVLTALAAYFFRWDQGEQRYQPGTAAKPKRSVEA